MLATPRPRVDTYQGSEKVLVVSSISVSHNVYQRNAERPQIDYQALAEELDPDLIDSYNVPGMPSLPVRLANRVAGGYWAVLLATVLKQRNYRAIIALGEDTGFPLGVVKHALRLRIPLIVICHNVTSRSRAFYMQRLKAARGIDRFLLLSKSQHTVLTREYGVDPAKTAMLCNPVDHRFFRPMPDVPVQPMICSAGVTCRDYATFIAAARDLPVQIKIDANSLWHDDPLNVSLDDLPPQVEVYFNRTTAELRQLYAESQVVVVPLRDVSHAVGYTVIVEAMAMGKPVIATRIKQSSDFIREGWNGFYVEPGDVAGMRDRMRHLIDHPDEARRMGANGRTLIEEQSNIDLYVAQIVSALREAVARAR